MDIHDVESILGPPESSILDNGYQLWVYTHKNSSTTYFFKNYFLVKIDK